MLALGTYSLLLLLYLTSWNAIAGSLRSGDEVQKLEYAALLSSRTMFSSGSPSAWHLLPYDPETVVAGIAQRQGVVSPQKAAALAGLNGTYYDGIRQALGAGEFQVYLNISGAYEFGIAPAKNSSARTIERLMVLNGSSAKVAMTVWK